jgi:hypothetical protein
MLKPNTNPIKTPKSFTQKGRHGEHNKILAATAVDHLASKVKSIRQGLTLWSSLHCTPGNDLYLFQNSDLFISCPIHELDVSDLLLLLLNVRDMVVMIQV